MGGMGLIFTPVLVRCLLSHLGLSRPMTGTSWILHAVLLEGITHLQMPTCTHHPPYLLSTLLPLICAICDITVIVGKVAQNPAVLASYTLIIRSYETQAKRLL